MFSLSHRKFCPQVETSYVGYETAFMLPDDPMVMGAFGHASIKIWGKMMLK